MLKGLFCHDGPVYLDDHGKVYDFTLTNQVLSRYFTLASEFTIIIRTQAIKDNKPDLMSQISLENIQWVGVPNLFSIKGQVFEKIEAKSIIEKNVKQADVVVARLPSIAGTYAVKYAKKYNKPYMVELVGCPWDALWNHSLKGKLIAPFMFLATKQAVQYSQYALYVTNEFLQRRYPCKGKTMGCSDVAIPPLDERVLEKRLTKIGHLSVKQPLVLGTVAAVNVHYKGQQYVIEAISRLNKQGYNFEYQLVGGGDHSFLKSVAVRQGVSDKVKFLGSMSQEKVFEYIDHIDVYVQPSKQEGLPRALVEAMSRGCPAVGSTAGGIPELLTKEFIFRSGDVNELCALLRKLDKKTLLEGSKRSFQKAKEYDKNVLDQRRTAFYKEFAGSSGLRND